MIGSQLAIGRTPVQKAGTRDGRFFANAQPRMILCMEKRQEIAAALDELAEEDTAGFQCFVQARFNSQTPPELQRQTAGASWIYVAMPDTEDETWRWRCVLWASKPTRLASSAQSR